MTIEVRCNLAQDLTFITLSLLPTGFDLRVTQRESIIYFLLFSAPVPQPGGYLIYWREWNEASAASGTYIVVYVSSIYVCVFYVHASKAYSATASTNSNKLPYLTRKDWKNLFTQLRPIWKREKKKPGEKRIYRIFISFLLTLNPTFNIIL